MEESFISLWVTYGGMQPHHYIWKVRGENRGYG